MSRSSEISELYRLIWDYLDNLSENLDYYAALGILTRITHELNYKLDVELIVKYGEDGE